MGSKYWGLPHIVAFNQNIKRTFKKEQMSNRFPEALILFCFFG
jgi:hypothetical protein